MANDLIEPVNFSSAKKLLEGSGFKQMGIPNRNVFLRVSPRPHWWSVSPWYSRTLEFVVVGNLMWFYERMKTGWGVKSQFKTWGRSEKTLGLFLKKALIDMRDAFEVGARVWHKNLEKAGTVIEPPFLPNGAGCTLVSFDDGDDFEVSSGLLISEQEYLKSRSV